MRNLENNYTLKKINREEYLKKGQIPLEDFFKKREIANVLLSPDGKYLAYLKPFKKRMNIHVRRLDGSELERRITNQTERDIFRIQWKGNDTIIFSKDFGGDENFHIFRVSVTGEGEKDLTPFEDTKVHVVDILEDLSEDHILISTNQRDKRVFDVYRLNVITGELVKVAENPGSYMSWMTDHNGKLRVALSSDGLEHSVYYRDTERDDFQKIMTTNFDDEFTPLLFTFDNKNLYVLSNLNKDKVVIEIFDPQKKKILSTLFSHSTVDVINLGYSKKRKVLTAALFITWKKQFHFFDSKIKRIFKSVQSKFPEKEIDLISMNKKEDLAVFFVCSDRNPGTYYLYDTKSTKLEKIADACPWLKEEDLAEDRPIQYTSRDGLVIHGYLTLPKGSSGKNLPVVVNPHGGPWLVRDVWGYNPEKQFLANRGYAVLQMNFRGSKGYGKKFFQASFKQWGRKMQDDVTDGVQYLIDKGIADKKRIGIYGGSYGGYVVLAGLAFTPDLYACGVDYVGISNIFTHLKATPPYWKLVLEQLYDIVGHPERDEQLLKEISPLFHVDKIKTPLFVAHGVNDPRVKKSESDQIVLSLKERGIETLYMVKDNEGHGFRNEENRIEFYTLLESFLEAHLLNKEANL